MRSPPTSPPCFPHLKFFRVKASEKCRYGSPCCLRPCLEVATFSATNWPPPLPSPTARWLTLDRSRGRAGLAASSSFLLGMSSFFSSVMASLDACRADCLSSELPTLAINGDCVAGTGESRSPRDSYERGISQQFNAAVAEGICRR